GTAWDWDILPPVRVRFGEPDTNGWRRGTAIVRVPEGYEGSGLILSVHQAPDEVTHFDNVAIYLLSF
ncbi:MAG: hypothetical protein IJQ73_14385, partial [Kiritimatiellae bacterium]|nr:hypothetical protein [Kiritimatiellia bacterium]